MTSKDSQSAPADAPVSAGDVRALTAALVEIDSAHRRIRHRLAHDLGFSTSELTAIYLVGTIKDCTPKQLAAELDLSTGAITAMVDRLEKSGHLERRVHPSDRRRQLLVATSKGRAANEAIMRLYDTAIENVVESFPGMCDADLVEGLRRAAEAIDKAAWS
ncbi:MarR family winged helix-turn-helix transcriptional regulator [Frondihabitans peucedani]|uniref:HTH marR-type domain-containing protein n=1 Tax=Frondihabitans peucedani TaxID=598626 RepID=A0ABP8E2V0_9MICO